MVLVAALAALGIAVPGAGAAVKARGSIDEAYVLGANNGESLTLLQRGKVLDSGNADRFGSKIFRDLQPGRGYRVRRANGTLTRRFKVLRPGANPPRSFYKRKKLVQGLNYVKVRDGVELAMTVRLPPGKTLADGPFPTFIEYSGYQVAAPHDLLTSIASLSAATSKRPARPLDLDRGRRAASRPCSASPW